MGLRPLEICQYFQNGDRLYTSESDVYRRQIPTAKDGPRAERVKNIFSVLIQKICQHGQHFSYMAVYCTDHMK